MIPEAIQVKHIHAALARVRRGRVPPRRESTKFDLLVDGERFPPKYVIALAAEEANVTIDDFRGGFSGGRMTNNFLKKLGFTVIPKFGPMGQD
jgi:hypothetical protein